MEKTFFFDEQEGEGVGVRYEGEEKKKELRVANIPAEHTMFSR